MNNQQLDELGRKMISETVMDAQRSPDGRLADIPIQVGALCIIASALSSIDINGLWGEGRG